MSEDTPTVDNLESTQEVQETPKFSSVEDAYAAARQTRSGVTEEAKEEEAPEAVEAEEETTEVAEAKEAEDATEDEESEEQEEGEESEDVLSQVEDIDFDSLPQEVQDAIAEKLEVRSHVAFAEMRNKLRDTEKELTALQEQKANEVVESVNGKNSFSEVSDLSALEKEVSQAQTNVDYFTESLLRSQTTQYDESKGEDVNGILHEGKFYDKEFILNYIEGQKLTVKDGQTRSKQLKSYQELQKNQDELVAKSKTTLGITADSEASTEYDRFLDNPNFKTVLRAMPDYAKDLIEVFGQAAVAKVGSKSGKILIPRKGPKGKSTSATPSSRSASPAQSTSNSGKLAALTKRLKQGVSSKDEALNLARQQRVLRKT